MNWYCPYCGNKLADERTACCGEIGHAAPECDTCHGTGAADAPTSEADPCCPDCDGSGYANESISGITKACRDCGRLFHPALSDDTYCRSCTALDDELTDQNGFRLRSEHYPK